MISTPAPRPVELDPTLRQAYLSLVEEQFGLRLTDHQARNLEQIVGQILERSNTDNPHELIDQFRGGRALGLLEDLAISLSIGETHFFQVRPQIEALRQTVLPRLIEARRSSRRLRIWSAGCSTGEEPYTVAILLGELLSPSDGWDTKILGTDFSRPALETAREALYRDWSFRDTPEEVRDRYFEPEDRRYRLVESVRKMVTFRHLNLAAEYWPTLWPDSPRFDLVLCRNVTIYFGPEAARRLNRRLGESLAADGWLVLGPSDPSPESAANVEPVNLPGAVLWRPERAVERVNGAQPVRLRPSDAPPELANGGILDLSVRPASPLRLADSSGRSGRPGGEPLPDRERARKLAQRGERIAAKLEAERWARAWPLDAEAHLLLGMLNLDEGLVEPAIRSFRRAALLDEDNGLVHFNLGTAYLRVGDPARARSSLAEAQRVLSTAPDEAIAACGVGVSAQELRVAVEEQLAALG